MTKYKLRWKVWLYSLFNLSKQLDHLDYCGIIHQESQLGRFQTESIPCHCSLRLLLPLLAGTRSNSMLNDWYRRDWAINQSGCHIKGNCTVSKGTAPCLSQAISICEIRRIYYHYANQLLRSLQLNWPKWTAIFFHFWICIAHRCEALGIRHQWFPG